MVHKKIGRTNKNILNKLILFESINGIIKHMHMDGQDIKLTGFPATGYLALVLGQIPDMWLKPDTEFDVVVVVYHV